MEALEERQLLASSGLGSFFSGFFPTFSSPTTNNPTNKTLRLLLHQKPSISYPTFNITLQVNHLSDPGGTGVVFNNNKVLVEGLAKPYSTVYLAQGPLGYFNTVARADAGGYYIFDVAIPAGRTTQIRTFAESPAQSYSQIATVQVTAANPIVSWDAIARKAIRNQALSAPEAARDLAILHTAQYNAVAAASGADPALATQLAATPGASANAAANAAAAGVLASLLPAQNSAFTAALTASMRGQSDSPSLRNGTALGEAAAQQVLLARANDGATAATGGGTISNPDFSRVQPFALAGASAFRPAAAPRAGSAAFDQSLAEVASLGRFNSTTRTLAQTEAVAFWANLPGSDTDSSHWNAIAEEQATVRQTSLLGTARLFAELDAALADTSIATADARDANPTVARPAPVIQATDPTWQPLIATPATSAYPSAEAATGAAASRVLGAFFGTATPLGTTANATAAQPLRLYPNFAAAGVEDGVSRISAGDDYRFAVDAGATLGTNVAGVALAHFTPGSK